MVPARPVHGIRRGPGRNALDEPRRELVEASDLHRNLAANDQIDSRLGARLLFRRQTGEQHLAPDAGPRRLTRRDTRWTNALAVSTAHLEGNIAAAADERRAEHRE